jgi:hypothetical protein
MQRLTIKSNDLYGSNKRGVMPKNAAIIKETPEALCPIGFDLLWSAGRTYDCRYIMHTEQKRLKECPLIKIAGIKYTGEEDKQ